MSNAAKRLLPMEEADDVLSQVEAVGFDLIRLVASTTTGGRLQLVLGRLTTSSTTSLSAWISGTRFTTADNLAAAVPKLRAHTTLPVAISLTCARQCRCHRPCVADAAVVASVLIETLAKSLEADGCATHNTASLVLGWVRDLLVTARSARTPFRLRELTAGVSVKPTPDFDRTGETRPS